MIRDILENFTIAALSAGISKTASAPFELWRIQNKIILYQIQRLET